MVKKNAKNIIQPKRSFRQLGMNDILYKADPDPDLQKADSIPKFTV